MKLNDEQKAIVNSPKGFKTCNRYIAGAGSGKSTTMAFRTKKFLDDGISKDKIALMTFSNRASRDLMLKLKSITGLKPSKLPNVSTIHGLCLDILRYYSPDEFVVISSWEDMLIFRDSLEKYADLEKLPKKVTTPIAKQIADTISELYSCYEIDRYKSQLSDIFYDNSEYYEKADQNLIVTLTFKDFYEVVKRADKFKRANGLLSFDDILYRTFELLIDNPKDLADLRKRIPYITIDEAQDNSTLQHLFVYNVFNTGNVGLVYDPMQEIYKFRFSNSTYLKEENLFKVFNEVNTYHLSTNYRSSHAIVKLGNILREFGKSEIIQEPSSHNKHIPNNVYIKQVRNQASEANQVIKQVKELLKNGAEPRDIAVITRTNRYISTNLEPAFVENGIPYIIQGSKTKKMTDKSEILYIINCLQLMVASPRAQVYIAKQILIHMEGIGEKTAQEFSRILESGIFNLIEANPRKGESIIGLLKFILSESLKGLDGSKLGSYIETFLNYSKFDIKDRYLQEIKQLFSNWCEIYMEDMDRTLEQIIPDIQTAIDSVDEDTSNSVRLTTIHAVKGLEYDHVIACGFTYRSQNMVKLNEEELNMFYVQISRAIKSVMIVYSDFVKYMGEEEQGYKSKWLVKLLQYLNR